MYFNPMAQYMPNYMFGSLVGRTSQKNCPIKLDLKPNHSGDILAVVGLTAATVGLCLLGNTKGAKKTAEAAAKTAAKGAKETAKGGFWSKLFAKKGAEKAHKKIIKASNLISRDGVFFSKDGTLYTGWAKSWGKKMLYKDGVLVKTINRKGVQVALSQETPIQRRIRENILHKSICVKSAKESAEVFKKAEAAQKTSLLTRMHSKVREVILPQEFVLTDKFKTPQSLVTSLPIYQKTGNIVADMQKMLQKMISGDMKITQVNEFLKANKMPLITLGKGDKANIKAVKTYIKNLQNLKGQATRDVAKECRNIVMQPTLSISA